MTEQGPSKKEYAFKIGVAEGDGKRSMAHFFKIGF